MSFEKGLEEAVGWEVILFLSGQEIGDGSSFSRAISVGQLPNFSHKTISCHMHSITCINVYLMFFFTLTHFLI